MFAGITAALGGIKGLAIGALIIMLAVAGWKIEQDIEALGALKQVNAQLLATNAQNVTQLAKIQADYQAAQAALSDALHVQAAQAAQKATIDQGINNAPSSDDGPVAPVLRRTVDGLFGHPGAANPNP